MAVPSCHHPEWSRVPKNVHASALRAREMTQNVAEMSSRHLQRSTRSGVSPWPHGEIWWRVQRPSQCAYVLREYGRFMSSALLVRSCIVNLREMVIMNGTKQREMLR